MISDVLSEAVDEIDRYLREMPHAYAPYRAPLMGLIAQMDYWRKMLDGPPYPAYWQAFDVKKKSDPLG